MTTEARERPFDDDQVPRLLWFWTLLHIVRYTCDAEFGLLIWTMAVFTAGFVAGILFLVLGVEVL